MKKNTKTLLSVLLCIFLLFGCGKKTLESPSETWKQDKFIISSFRAVTSNTDYQKRALTLNKEAGIDLVELTFIESTAVDAAVRAAEEVGIFVMPQDFNTFSGFQDVNVPKVTEGFVKERINSLKNFKMVYGYYIWDEPLMEHLTSTKRISDIVKQIDPKRLCFSVMFPSYGPYKWENSSYKRYVDRYLAVVDPEVVSFNYYPYRIESDKLTNNDIWKDFGYIRLQALKLNKPLWFYFQGCRIHDTDIPIDVNRIRAQMNAALAYGVKGLSYYFTSPGDGALLDNNYEKTDKYDDLKVLHKEIKNVGNLLFDKQPVKLYHTTLPDNGHDAYYLNDFTQSELFSSAPEDLVIGLFKDSETEKYVIVSNLKHNEAVKGEIELKKTMTVKTFNKTNNIMIPLLDSASTLDLDLAAGESIIYLLQ